MMIDPPNHHGHLRAANPVVSCIRMYTLQLLLLHVAATHTVMYYNVCICDWLLTQSLGSFTDLWSHERPSLVAWALSSYSWDFCSGAFRCGTGWADTSTMMSRWGPSNPLHLSVIGAELLRLRCPRPIFNEVIICTWQKKGKDNKQMATNNDGWQPTMMVTTSKSR